MKTFKTDFRTYITSGSTSFNWSDAMDFCQSQHSKGLVTFDTEEKYLDIKRIVGPEGENSWAFTALYNPTGTRCSLESHDSLPTCSSLLVRFLAKWWWFLCFLWAEAPF